MRLQFLSDVHLEYRYAIPVLKPAASYLALLGDIGNPFQANYSSFLQQASQKFDKVFLISGNHEYLYNNVQQTDNRISDVCSNLPNVYYLNNRSIEIDNIIVLGTTLWTLNHPLHQKSVNFIKDNLSTQESLSTGINRKRIVLTHHLPSYQLILPQFSKYSYIYDRYASHLDYLIQKPIAAWLCGHSHCKLDMHINGVYCGINANWKGDLQVRIAEIQ